LKQFLFALLIAFLPFPGLSGCRSHRPGAEFLSSVSAETQESPSESEEEGGLSDQQHSSSEPPPRSAQRSPDKKRATGLRPIPAIKVTRRREQKTPSGASANDKKTATPDRSRWTGREEKGRLIIDDFEGKLHWKPVSWTNANDCDLSPGEVNNGHLSIRCKPGKEEKAAIQLRFPRPLDLSGFHYVAVRGRVEERQGEASVDVAVGFQTRAYFESARLPVGQKLDPELRISLSRTDYKTSPDWEYNSPLSGHSRVETIFLLMYYEKACRVVIDEVYLGKEPREGPSADSAAEGTTPADREEEPLSETDGGD
jgi:hypothetical protein